MLGDIFRPRGRKIVLDSAGLGQDPTLCIKEGQEYGTPYPDLSPKVWFSTL